MASASMRPIDLADLEPPAGSVDRAHGPRPPDWGEEKIAASGRPMPLRQNARIDESSDKPSIVVTHGRRLRKSPKMVHLSFSTDPAEV